MCIVDVAAFVIHLTPIALTLIARPWLDVALPTPTVEVVWSVLCVVHGEHLSSKCSTRRSRRKRIRRLRVGIACQVAM